MKKWHHTLTIEFESDAEFVWDDPFGEKPIGTVEPISAANLRREIAEEISPTNGLFGHTHWKNAKILHHVIRTPEEVKQAERFAKTIRPLVRQAIKDLEVRLARIPLRTT